MFLSVLVITPIKRVKREVLGCDLHKIALLCERVIEQDNFIAGQFVNVKSVVVHGRWQTVGFLEFGYRRSGYKGQTIIDVLLLASIISKFFFTLSILITYSL